MMSRFTSCFFDNVISAVIDPAACILLLTTALGSGGFPGRSNGSLIHKDNVITRAQRLSDNRLSAAGYFHGRPLRHRRYAL
ncbi:potassium-transporting ATPase subunit C [Salmonella enterica subsp. enterica serovar Sanjuan]|uniref:Potassium-transporting ATPase subunit C n=1 Tax=Salmonella enterica subsp. enterica serovar Sanjuan TaxID=1160765 RepID=A0A3S5DBZ1_SALET|nr:potassium-transporting ATPase subunit C [Salmonella enterica subsp. enterica serovar Sanjuan]